LNETRGDAAALKANLALRNEQIARIEQRLNPITSSGYPHAVVADLPQVGNVATMKLPPAGDAAAQLAVKAQAALDFQRKQEDQIRAYNDALEKQHTATQAKQFDRAK